MSLPLDELWRDEAFGVDCPTCGKVLPDCPHGGRHPDNEEEE
jgi:ribosomal protein S27E